MARHVASLLCKRASIDSRTHALSLFELVEGLEIEVNDSKVVDGERDIAPVEMQLVIMVARTDPNVPEHIKARSSLVLPTKKRLVGRPFEVDLRTNFGSQSILDINGLPIEGSGQYEFVTEFAEANSKGWRRVASFPFMLTLSTMEVESDTKASAASAKKDKRPVSK